MRRVSPIALAVAIAVFAVLGVATSAYANLMGLVCAAAVAAAMIAVSLLGYDDLPPEMRKRVSNLLAVLGGSY